MICTNCNKEFTKALKANSLSICCSRNCSLALWRAKNRDKLRIYHNDWLHENQANHTLHNANWRLRNPNKSKAEGIVNYAVRKGELKKEPCEVCGTDRVHAHHPDYSRPLFIKWLCPLHHKQVHMEVQNG